MSPTVPTAECQNISNSNTYQDTYNQKQNKNNLNMSKIRINTSKQSQQPQSQDNMNMSAKSVSTPTAVQTPDYMATMAATDVQAYTSMQGAQPSPASYYQHAVIQQQQPWNMHSYPTMPIQTPYTTDMHLSTSPQDPVYLSVSGMNSPTPMYHHGQSLSMTSPVAPHVFGSYRPKTPVSHQGKDTPVSTRNDTPNSNISISDSKKKNNRKSTNENSRFPVVKIPEALKKMGQPHPAFYLNSHGFPLRSGKPDCKHYISKGWCAYGTLCKFNHPDSAAAQSFAIVPAAPMPTSPGYIQAHWPGMVPASGYHWGPWAPPPPPPPTASTTNIHGVTSPMTPTAYSMAAASSPAAGCYPCMYQAPTPTPPPIPQTTTVTHPILSDESLNSTMSHQLCDESDQVSDSESLGYDN